jgi:DeoR/GlpR family transcriptional regulator of sugar metabolism
MNQPSTPKRMSDVINLPDDQRQIANWIIKQKKVTLAEIIDYTNLAEQIIQENLQILISAGFISEINENGLVFYQTCLSQKPKSQLSQKIWDNI